MTLPSTRRTSHGGVAMSLEMRPPRELLARIGLSGKEVVKIIKAMGWDIVEPHGLQQQNLYYIPGVLEKATDDHEPIQNAEYFVGEGELYAFILQEGGLRYLLPPEELSSDSELDESSDTPVKPATDDSDVEDQVFQDSSDQRKWKKRKKLSTAKTKSMETLTYPGRKMTRDRKSDKKEEKPVHQMRTSTRAKLEHETDAAIGQQTEFLAYQNSLKARGWRAQLLQDIDVHLLRSTAAVSRTQRARTLGTDKPKKSTQPMEGIGPHVTDATEIHQEIEELMNSIRASQDDLSLIIESVITDGEQWMIPDRIDVVGRIGIPGFVSTGSCSLVLMRDIERYLLLFVAAVRRYQRTRKAICASEPSSELSLPSNRTVKRKELRALQLGIEESKREMQELAAIVAAEVTKSCQDAAQNSALLEDEILSTSRRKIQTMVQGSSQSTSRTVRAHVSGT